MCMVHVLFLKLMLTRLNEAILTCNLRLASCLKQVKTYFSFISPKPIDCSTLPHFLFSTSQFCMPDNTCEHPRTHEYLWFCEG